MTTGATITVGAQGVYTVTVTNAAGCTATATQSVTVNAAPTPQISGSTTFCTGGSALLDAGTGFTNYLWSTTATTATITVNTAGTYTVTVTNAAGCTGVAGVTVTVSTSLSPQITGNPAFCPGLGTTLNAGNGFASYNWSSGGSTATINVNAPGTYTVTVSDASGCTGTAAQVVSLSPVPVPMITGNTQLCTGNSTSLDAGAGFTTYAWQGGNTTQIITTGTAGTYTVTVTNAAGCTGTGSVSVTVNTGLTPQITGTPTFCAGANTTLNAGTGFATYLWTNGQTTAALTVSQPGVYTVTVSDVSGCSGTASLQVNLTELNVSVDATPPTCTGFENGMIAVETVNGGTNPYNYSLNGAPGTTNTFEDLPAGTYTLLVEDAGGCQWEQDVELDEPLQGTVDAGLDRTIAKGASTVLTATTNLTAAQISVSAWSPATWLNCADNCLETIATPLNTQEYTISITDNNGCVISDRVLVQVEEEFNIYFPNVFNPLDENNSKFIIGIGDGVRQIKSYNIYDRWGERVYFKTGIAPADIDNVGWDGSFRGKDLNPGVYIYVVEIELLSGEVKLYKGDVTLLR